MLEQFIKKDGNFHKLMHSLNNQEKVSVFGTTLNEQTSLFADVHEPLVYVVSSYQKAQQVLEKFNDLNKECAILYELSDYSFSELNDTAFQTTQKALQHLGKETDVLIVTPEVLLQKFPFVNQESLVLKTGNSYNLQQLVTQLLSLGYERVELVEREYQFALRGDILDLFVSPVPFRISFFGNEIEFMKPFDLVTQLTSKITQETVEVFPSVESDFKQILHPAIASVQNATKQNNLQAKENLQHILQTLSQNLPHNPLWSSVFATKHFTFFEQLPKNSTVVFDEPKQIYDLLVQKIAQCNEEFLVRLTEGNALKEHKNFYPTLSELFTFPQTLGLVTFGTITTSNRIFQPSKVFSLSCATLQNYQFNKNMLIYDLKQFQSQHFTIIIFAKDTEFATTLSNRLLSENIPNSIVGTLNQAQVGSVNLVTKTRNTTFGILEEKLVVIGTSKLLKKAPSKVAQTDVGVTKQELLPNIGDYVVHETHGIGKCVAMQKITVNNISKDYVVLEYKHGDRLFLPVENLDVVAKYVGSDKTPTLNKLGGTEFFNTKQKVKKQLKETAIDLVKLYAAREAQHGVVFPADDEFQMAFEDEFSYTETPDQLKAINDTKADMQSAKIMDRLICGDVGYGKTEVALRAIFKAVNAGYQVAFLCPTTILSQQHYNTCVSRMQNFGVQVSVLNRFKTPKEQKAVLQAVTDGSVQVLVGTHRLLSSDVKFKNLGLLVLDEEQKFGVVDKEKIKTLKQHIDVLTLSATPIPRSLHMAMVGIRDISIIETPPPMKMPVLTQVVELNDQVLKGAIHHELERGGQVLIVFNNIEHITSFTAHIKSLVANHVAVSFAHGQMTEVQLENEIVNLYNGITQVLISTTLIENGIDLPTANTLIVINSDLLGLSQLYQLKGRVGRGNVQAYAYFTYERSKFMNENAIKRMEAIGEFTQLGDGYKIAMRDLEIRGAGNVLGVEQSGHLQKVGYAMYIALLKEAVAEIRGEIVAKNYDVKMETEFAANLPNYYVSSTPNRIKLFHEIALLKTLEEAQVWQQNTQQVYGEVPEELENLCFVAVVKNMAKQLPLKKITLKTREMKLEFLPEFEKWGCLVQKVLETKAEFIVINSANLPILTITNFASRNQAVGILASVLKSMKEC